LDTGRRAAARDHVRAVIQEWPAAPQAIEARLLAARIDLADGRLDDAAAACNALINDRRARGRPQGEALLLLGRIFQQRDEPVAALGVAQRLLVMFGGYPELQAEAGRLATALAHHGS
jgi:thioredoxin-like negative regulator of GroEL